MNPAVSSATAAFLLVFPALFSIVNPPGAAFIFNEVTSAYTDRERARLAWRVALYSLMVILAALWGGAFILSFFGISLGALRIAGGSVVALRAWELLNAPERQEARKQEQAEARVGSIEEVAFFPLTLPFTAGPGTISVAIALGAQRPTSGVGLLYFFLGASAAAIAIALCVWIAYRSAERLGGMLGPTGRRTISRLSAFLLLCIGVQIVVNGVLDVVALIEPRAPG
jgi:multiple antibiotic resistance protein